MECQRQNKPPEISREDHFAGENESLKASGQLVAEQDSLVLGFCILMNKSAASLPHFTGPLLP
jgi:hypothetical protein